MSSRERNTPSEPRAGLREVIADEACKAFLGPGDEEARNRLRRHLASLISRPEFREAMRSVAELAYVLDKQSLGEAARALLSLANDVVHQASLRGVEDAFGP